MNDNSLLLNIEIDSEFLIVYLICTNRLEWKEKMDSWNSLYDSEKLAYGLSLFLHVHVRRN